MAWLIPAPLPVKIDFLLRDDAVSCHLLFVSIDSFLIWISDLGCWKNDKPSSKGLQVIYLANQPYIKKKVASCYVNLFFSFLFIFGGEWVGSHAWVLGLRNAERIIKSIEHMKHRPVLSSKLMKGWFVSLSAMNKILFQNKLFPFRLLTW